jgi:pimeloyl-ACP methyl ester carboxylesterase
MSRLSATVSSALILTLLAVVFQLFYSISPERDSVLLRSDTSAWAASGAYANFNGVALFYHTWPTRTPGSGAEREKSNLQNGRGAAPGRGCEEKNAPSLVLLHGFPTSSFDFAEAWDDIVDTAAAAGMTCVVAMDFVGFGLSDKPAAHAFNYSVHAQADAVEWLVGRHLGLKTAGVLAHDYGSTVAQELLARITLASSDGAAVVPFVLLNAGLLPEAHRPRTVQWLLARFPSLGPLVGRPMYQRAVAGVFGPETQPSQGTSQGLSILLRKTGVGSCVESSTYALSLTDWLDAAWALMAHKGGAALGGE